MADSTARLVLMIGLPGSGKTTLAAAIAQNCPPSRVVSTDRVRAQLYGDEAIQGNWRCIWAEVERQLQVAPGSLAIYDATNAVRRHRRRAIAQFRYLGFRQIFGLWLDVPLAECLIRNQGRSRQVPEAVIQRMARCLNNAPPALSDGLDALVRYRSPGLLDCPLSKMAGVEIAAPPPQ